MTDAKWQKPDLHVAEPNVGSSENDRTLLVAPEPEAVTGVNSQQRIPGYSALQKIAQGSSGTVFSARNDSDGSKVAIKIFKKDLTPNPDAVRRFKQEVETLSKLSHPNIVKIIGSGTTADSESYTIMELVDGVSVRTLLETEGVFQPRRAALVAREICRALGAAHAEGIIHRDLKPNNIVLDNKNVVKVVDFGVAKAVASSNDTITEYGSVIGTPAYMSPEQCLGQKVDERSDIYSLGCTLFEMLTGVKAFASSTTVEAIAKQISADRSHIGALLVSTGAPLELQCIVAKCVDREPARRYKTIAELDHDLSSFLLGVPLTFAPINRQEKQVTVAVCAIVIAIMLVAVNWWYGLQSKAPTERLFPAGGPGIQIRNRHNKILFSDPIATDMVQALKAASERHISLSHADLRNANLTDLKLISLDLSSADLTGAQLRGSRLTDVDLQGALLTQASLSQATLVGVNLRNAQLSCANVAHLRAPAVILDGADLSSATLTGAHLERSSCKGTNFTNANLTGASLEAADCKYANFQGVRVSPSQFLNANCAGATFTDLR